MRSSISLTLTLLPLLVRSASAVPNYNTLTTHTNGSTIRAVINNPPINLWDYKLASDISTFVSSLASPENTTAITTSAQDIKTVIFSSANPDFFISHYDIHALDFASPVLAPGNATTLGNQLLQTRTLLATLPIVFIAEINGRTSGAGNEFAVQCDIRYAGPAASLSHLEVGFGLPPGAGGVQFLVKLIGRARALEYILTGRSVDAVTAAAIGWVNSAFESAEDLTRNVDALAARIAQMPAQGLAAVKARVNVQKPSEADLEGDNELFFDLVATNVTQEAADRFLVLGKNQTESEFELNLPAELPQIVPVGV